MIPNGPTFPMGDWLFRSHVTPDGYVWATDCRRLAVKRVRVWTDQAETKAVERYMARAGEYRIPKDRETLTDAMRACVEAIQSQEMAA